MKLGEDRGIYRLDCRVHEKHLGLESLGKQDGPSVKSLGSQQKEYELFFEGEGDVDDL